MTEEVELEPGRYSLVREQDGMGDSGPWIESFDWGAKKAYTQNVLVKGMGVRCGSVYGRTYVAQDWWLTTAIVEFLEVAEDKSYVKFSTESGSIYEVKLL